MDNDRIRTQIAAAVLMGVIFLLDHLASDQIMVSIGAPSPSTNRLAPSSTFWIWWTTWYVKSSWRVKTISS